jgi:hypothetical protein
MYGVVANEIVQGGRPYIDAIERKPPLLFWTYAAIFKVMGPYNWRGLHGAAVVWTLLTMAGLYALAAGLFGCEAGLMTAFLYSVYQPWAHWKELAFNGEVMMNLPIVWAWVVALGPTRGRLRPELLVAGALSCAAFLFKQPAAIAAIPLMIYPLLPSYRASRSVTSRESLIHAGWVVIGFLATMAGVAVLLRHEGILWDAIYWTIGDHDVPHVYLTRGILLTLAFVGVCLPLVLGAARSFGDPAWSTRHAERTALVGLLAVSAVGVAASGRFFMHYYIQLFPPLVVLAGAYYGLFRHGASRGWVPAWTLTRVWIAVTVVAFSIAHWYGLASQWEPSESGRYVFEHSRAEERMFVWGQSPAIYVDANRRPASRYITTFPLTGWVFGGALPGVDTRSRISPGAWGTLQQDFARHPPSFIVDTEADANALYPVSRFPLLANLVAQDFQPLIRTAEGHIVYGRCARVQTRCVPSGETRGKVP